MLTCAVEIHHLFLDRESIEFKGVFEIKLMSTVSIAMQEILPMQVHSLFKYWKNPHHI